MESAKDRDRVSEPGGSGKVVFTPYNPDYPSHSIFLFQLLKEGGASYYDDAKRDPLMRLKWLGEEARRYRDCYFIVLYDGEPAGFLSCILDGFDVAYIDGLALKRFRSFWPARNSLMAFCKHIFKNLKAAKITAYIPIFNKDSEIVCRSIGFRKEGLKRRVMTFNGERVDATDLALFPPYISEQVSKGHLKEFLRKQHNGKKQSRTAAGGAEHNPA